MEKAGRKREVSFRGALLVLGGVFAILAGGKLLFDMNIVVLLLASGLFTTALFRGVYGFSLADLFGRGVAPLLGRSSGALAILLSVGPLIAAWTMAGTIPYLVWSGLRLLAPAVFLPSVFLICSLASLLTGTSWGTAGTFGIAFMAIAEGLGIPAPVTAGAIVGGAYFGDKLSPVSDTTVLAAAVAEVDVVDHIRGMLWTTLPGFFLSLGFYALMGGSPEENLKGDLMSSMISSLQGAFRMTPLLLLPPILLLVLAWRRHSIFIVLWVAVLSALPFALYQGYSPGEILRALAAGPRVVTGSASLDELMGRGGLLFMGGVAAVVSLCFLFAGQLEITGVFRAVSRKLQDSFIGLSRGRFVLAVSLSGLLVSVSTGNSYLSEIIPGTMFRETADSLNVSRRVLSRTLEDSGTMIVPLVPWSAAGIYLSSVLGVPVAAYAPWALLCYLGIVTAWIYALTETALWPSEKKGKEE